MHAHPTRHTSHTHHAHTHHNHMYTRVYKCTHCGRKGHLTKFCYDTINSINFANKNVWFWVRLTPVDPKENRYQNPTSCVWCRCGLSPDVRGLVPWWWMHDELDRYTKLMHHYQGSLVGGPPCFGDLENSSYSLLTISKLPFSLHSLIWMFLTCFSFVLLVVDTEIT